MTFPLVIEVPQDLPDNLKSTARSERRSRSGSTIPIFRQIKFGQGLNPPLCRVARNTPELNDGRGRCATAVFSVTGD